MLLPRTTYDRSPLNPTASWEFLSPFVSASGNSSSSSPCPSSSSSEFSAKGAHVSPREEPTCVYPTFKFVQHCLFFHLVILDVIHLDIFV